MTGLPVGPRVDDTPASLPEPHEISGTYTRLEPLQARHAPDLLSACGDGRDAAARFRYLLDEPPRTEAEVVEWIAGACHGGERIGFAVVDRATERVGGRMFLMRISTTHRSIEVGNILFGSAIARTRVSTESIFLLARHCFEDLGYRRFEWKCDNLNAPSRRAAERLGFVFEGVFRCDFIVKGRSRDTAWYSITEQEWPARRAEFERWLAPGNFDGSGQQRTRLHHDIRAED